MLVAARYPESDSTGRALQLRTRVPLCLPFHQSGPGGDFTPGDRFEPIATRAKKTVDDPRVAARSDAPASGTFGGGMLRRDQGRTDWRDIAVQASSR
jgi:hypothetical protein